MKAIVALCGLVVGCGPEGRSSAPTTPTATTSTSTSSAAPPAPTCATAIAHGMGVIQGQLDRKDLVQAKRMRATLAFIGRVATASCEDDRWSPAVIACFMGNDPETVKDCDDHTTPEQQAQLKKRAAEVQQKECAHAAARVIEADDHADNADRSRAKKVRKLEPVLTQSCIEDGWPQDAVDCLANGRPDSQCNTLLTDAQLAKLLERTKKALED